jgi:hypothetical protein
MSSASAHYADLLAPIYMWMIGGTEGSFALGRSDLAAVIDQRGLAVDLGAWFGMHSVPLARAGWRVIAVDSSPILLAELEAVTEGLPVTTRCENLLAFDEALAPGEYADLVLCMGDTLTHLETQDQVVQLSQKVAGSLSAHDRFMATFRDYSCLPSGNARFIPVRADDRRILICFLEEFDEYVKVSDILHERAGDTWSTKVSSYRKLRVAPEFMRKIFLAAGLRTVIEQRPRGMGKRPGNYRIALPAARRPISN